MIQSYVVGFLFDNDNKRVVLIKKNKPKWQAGLLNGVGGKIEVGESPANAMFREFKEEAGLVIHDWTLIAKIYNNDYEVFFFKAKGDVEVVVSKESEEIVVVDVLKLPDNSLWDIRWLVPLAISDGMKFPILIESLLKGG